MTVRCVALQGEEGGGPPLPFAVGAAPAGCDVAQGEWVRDDDARPWYQEWECPYIQPQLTCQAHGRPDKAYQSWRWQPRGCSLPRYVRLALALRRVGSTTGSSMVNIACAGCKESNAPLLTCDLCTTPIMQLTSMAVKLAS